MCDSNTSVYGPLMTTSQMEHLDAGGLGNVILASPERLSASSFFQN